MVCYVLMVYIISFKLMIKFYFIEDLFIGPIIYLVNYLLINSNSLIKRPAGQQKPCIRCTLWWS